MTRGPLAVLLAASLLVAAACSDDSSRSATTRSTPATSIGAGPSTTTTAPEIDTALALRGDGLGVAAFGAPVEAVVAAVADVLGAPTSDSGWSASSGPFTQCAGEHVRSVEWDGLRLLFGDPMPTGSLLSWDVSGAPPAIAMPTGFGFGATAGDAHDLYGEHVELVPAEDPYPAFLRISVDGGRVTAFLDDDGTVTNLHGGEGCGGEE